jgi:hypothetical protein
MLCIRSPEAGMKENHAFSHRIGVQGPERENCAQEWLVREPSCSAELDTNIKSEQIMGQ